MPNIENIIDIWQTCDYDFNVYLDPADVVGQNNVDSWRSYYRLKYAICSDLSPSSILEIGVRAGYSAISFLKSCPKAKYYGIDNDSDAHGGYRGAVGHAQKILKSYDATIVIADSQSMYDVGESYDLAHVDGQQDYHGTIHDISLVSRVAKYILIDGMHWSQDNHSACCDWLFDNRALYTWACVIPSMAGELLIIK